MLNYYMIKPLGAILRKMGIKPIIDAIAEVNVDEENGKENLIKSFFMAIGDHLEDVADDLLELCAAYKDKPIEDVAKGNPIEDLKEIIAETGFKDFLSSAVASVKKK